MDDEDEEEDTLVHGRKKRKVAFQPSIGTFLVSFSCQYIYLTQKTDTTHTIYYRGHWRRITRTKRYPDYGRGSALKISYVFMPAHHFHVLIKLFSIVARNNDILKKLVLEAK